MWKAGGKMGSLWKDWRAIWPVQIWTVMSSRKIEIGCGMICAVKQGGTKSEGIRRYPWLQYNTEKYFWIYLPRFAQEITWSVLPALSAQPRVVKSENKKKGKVMHLACTASCLQRHLSFDLRPSAEKHDFTITYSAPQFSGKRWLATFRWPQPGISRWRTSPCKIVFSCAFA